MPLTPVNPPSLTPPRGYNHGMKGAGELLFVAGQVGWAREGSSDGRGPFRLAAATIYLAPASRGPRGVAGLRKSDPLRTATLSRCAQ